VLHAELLYNLHPYSTALASLPGLAASSTMLLPCLCGLADLMGHNVLNLALESGWADAAVDLEPVRSVQPPHHSANPCAGAVPQGLDAQATEIGTCLWAHGPLSTSHHFSPWQLWPFLVGGFHSFQYDH